MGIRLLHFIRHGQYTPGPHGGTLTALGRRQLRATARRLQPLGVAVIYSSDLGRARESASLIAERNVSAAIVTSRILRELLPTATPGVRVPAAARARARQALARIQARYFRGSRAPRHDVFVCHGNLIRALLMQVLDLRLAAWLDLEIHHGSVTTFSVRGPDRVRLVRFNDVGHIRLPLLSDR